jgi:hypothetical protein
VNNTLDSNAMIITERNGFNNSQVVDFEPEESDEEETDEQR